jgi:hypothetical protein
MRLLLVTFLIACGGAETPHAVPPKAPNNELITGEFERHPPDGTAAMRFRADNSFRIAKTRADLDKDPVIVEGHFQLDKDTLTLTAEKGACANDELSKVSIYKVVLSKIGIRFTKDTETCTARATMDGTTWFRAK